MTVSFTTKTLVSNINTDMLLIAELAEETAPKREKLLISDSGLHAVKDRRGEGKQRSGRGHNSSMLCNYLSTGQVGQKIKGEREL